MDKAREEAQKQPDSSLAAPGAPAKAPARDKGIEEGRVTVVCKERAGKTIVAVSGQPIAFNESGTATISSIDARYFADNPELGCAVKGNG